MKLALLTFLALATAFAAHAQTSEKPRWKKVLPSLPEGVELFEKVECSRIGSYVVPLDIYVPKSDGPHPAVLLIHGGGWQKRQVEADKPLAERLALRGYVVAQVAYRLATEAPYPAALHDSKAALRFLRANAGKYKIDPARIGCAGGSAGGHLSGLLGMTGGMKGLEGTGGNPDQSTGIKACVVMAATMDLVAANQVKNAENAVLFFGPFAEKQAVYAEASPITHVAKNSPPTLFIEGEKDTLKVGRAEMQDKLREAGVPTAIVTLKDAPHPFWMSQPWLDQTAEAMGDWFDKHLK